MKNAVSFCERNKLKSLIITTKTERGMISQKGINLELIPSSEYCYTVGRNLIAGKQEVSLLTN